MARVRIMGTSGHNSMVCEPSTDPTHTPEEINAEFERMIASNYKAFDVSDKSDPKEIKKFDPQIKDITIVPPMAGGM